MKVIFLDSENMLLDYKDIVPIWEQLFDEAYNADNEFSQRIRTALYAILDIDNASQKQYNTEERFQHYINECPNALPLSDKIFTVHYVFYKGEFTPCYEVPDNEHLLILTLIRLIKDNRQIRICGRCDKYFVLKGNYDNTYCTRIYELNGKPLPCVRIAMTDNYKKKLNDNPILQEYNRAYKREYARYKKAYGLGLKDPKLRNELFGELDMLRDKYVELYQSACEEDIKEQLLNEFIKLIGNKPKKK